MAEEFSAIPVMRVVDIVELLGEWGMNVTVEEILKPSPQTVQAIYDEFISQMIGIRMEDLEPSREAIMQDIEYPVRLPEMYGWSGGER